MTIEPARLQAAKALGRVLSTADGRAMLKINGYDPSGIIVVALESECLSDVYKRVTREVTTPPATVAIYFPQRDEVEFIGLMPNRVDGRGGKKDLHDIHTDSTIGAVWDYLHGSNKVSIDVSVTNWYGAEALKYKPLHEEPRSPLGRYYVSTGTR